MSEFVYRIQDADGRGPFRPGFSQKWADDDFAPGMKRLPTWGQEFGNDLITRTGFAHEHFGSAVRNLDDLGKWFSPSEMHRLHFLGFHIVMMRAGRILAESENQLVIARRHPLRSHIHVVPWPFERAA